MNRNRAFSALIVGVASGAVLVGATLYAGGRNKGQVRPQLAGPMIAGTVCMPDSFYYHFDLQDGPSIPGEINFNTRVQLWLGPTAEARMGLTAEEKSPFLRVEVYRPGDTDYRTEPLIRRESAAVTVRPGQVYKEVVPFQAQIHPHKEPYVVVVRMLNSVPGGKGETLHELSRFTYQVTGAEPASDR